MPEINEAQVKLALAAAKNMFAATDARRKFSIRQSDLYEGSQILRTNRRAVGDHFTSFLTKAGFEFDKFDKIREQNQTESRRILEEIKTESAKQSSSVKDTLRYEVDSLRKTIERLEDISLPHYPKPIVLASPFGIWTGSIPSGETQHIILDDSHIEPWNNWAEITLASEKTGHHYEWLSFYFIWENPSDRAEAFSVDTYLTLNGACFASTNAGFATPPFHKLMDLSIFADLILWEWWNQPPSYRYLPSEPVAKLFVRQHWYEWFGDSELQNVFGNYNRSYKLFLMPAHGVGVFEVAFTITYFDEYSGHGYCSVDFSDFGWQIMCPAVVISRFT
jgi:hypothetical protein